MDSLPAEPPGKPKNTGVGSPSLLQVIFLTQESNQRLLHCRWILYQLSFQGSPFFTKVDGKESACSAGDLGSIPGSGRSPGEGNGCPLQYCLESFMDRETWQATIGVWQIGADTRIYEQKTNGTTLETITASNPQNTAVSVEIQREGKHFQVHMKKEGLP